MENKYTPIDCNLYDVLEAMATQRKEVSLRYTGDHGPQEIKTMISNLVTRNKEEYLITSQQEEIRLDRIVAIDDIDFTGKFC